MSEVLQTYKQLAPPSIALALMAMELAYARIGLRPGDGSVPLHRSDVFAGGTWTSSSAEYYRIIDCLSRGERP